MHTRSIRLLALVGLVFLTGSVTSSHSHAQTPRATITFDNQSGEVALVKVIGPTSRQTEVPNGQKRTVTVAGGQYYIVTRYGTSPDKYSYSKGDPFKVTQTSTQHSVITITLHQVVDGNYHSDPISAAEFDRASP
jgi:hypothetical protein